jgi:hypothetical protein
MTIKTQLKGDRDVFLKDDRVNNIVTLLLEDDTIVYDQIVKLIHYTQDYDSFLIQISSLLNLIDTDLQELFWKYCAHLDNIYKDNNLCDNLRGAVLEKFVYKLLELKYYEHSNIYVSCYVIIRGWKSLKTVDVFYYSSDRNIGESFECKVTPYHFEKDHFINLKDIFFKSDESIHPSIACFTDEEAIKLKIKDLKITLGPIRIFGRENLKRIPL